MTATVIPIHATRPAPSSEEYLGWQLTLYENKESRSGEPRSAASADDLIESYREPLWLSPDDPRAVSGEAIKSGSPATTAGIGGRKKDTVGPARVLFVDYDRSAADGCDGLLPDEFEAFLTALQSWGVAFALHTTTSTAWLPEGRRKLRAVFPLEEPVLGEGYRRLWDTVAQHMQAACKVSPDKGKHSPENLMFLPVFRTDHSDRWGFWRSAQGARLLWDLPIAEAGLAAAATGDPYARVRTARNKDEARARAAFHVGAAYVRDEVGATTAEALQAHVDKVVWPEMRAALEACVAGGHSDPVKDWLGAEERTRRNFAAGVADAAREQETKLAARKAELLNELRLAAGFAQLLTIGKANGRNCKASCDSLQRLGSLVAAAADLGMPTEEASTIRARVLRAIDTNTTAAKAKLSAAWTAGLAVPVVVAEEMRAAQARVSWQDLGLIVHAKSGLPEACATNVELLFMKDPLLRSLFARNVRSVTDEFIVQRDHVATGLVAGQEIALADFAGFEWFRNYVASARSGYSLHDLERREYDAGLAAVLNSLPVVDPLVRYFEELHAGSCLDSASAWLDSFFMRHGGAPDTELNRAVTRAFFVSAVRTVFEPGAKTSLVWVLMGAQGIGKTLLLDALSPDPTYCGTISPSEIGGGRTSDSGRKPVKTAGRCFLIEVPELKLRGDYVEDWKGFVSDFTPYIRIPFARGERAVPRRGILVATTNNRDLFKDTTGNRRFPVLDLTTRVDLAAVRAERDQLWAEALRLYRLTPEDTGIPEHLWAAAAEQAEGYMDVDYIELHVRGLTDGSQAWPVACDQGTYSQLVGLRAEWETRNDVPRVLSLHQWVEITGCKQQNKLTAALRRAGWKPVRSFAFFQDDKAARLWVHPSP